MSATKQELWCFLLPLALVAALAGCSDAEVAATGTTSGDSSAPGDAGGPGADGQAGGDSASGVDDTGAADSAPLDDAMAADQSTVPDVAPDLAPGDVAPADVPPPVCSDEEKKGCDDKLACTEDSCSVQWGKPVCSWKLKADTCFIGGLCKKKGDAKPGDACAQCLPAQATATWSTAPDGTACDDGDLCTWNGACQLSNGKETCKSQPVPCNDKNACTLDVCDPKMGCTYPLANGATCTDGDACTVADTCLGGSCLGKKISCDDGKLCTDDGCDLASGCTHTDNSAPCSDGDACTVPDLCAKGSCVAGGPADCDDGNSCTVDVCDSGAGCYHLPLQSPCCIGQTSICDDGKPCTTDDCDPKTSGCSHKDNTVACDDGSKCTEGDLCAAGTCVPGKPKTCNDNSPCTNDACSPTAGCVFSPVTGTPCDDGNACTQNDLCTQGVCKGSGQCACKPTFSPQVQKLISVLIGLGGQPGEGLDLDDNPKTCAPSSNCSQGINNSLGALAGVANPQLDKAVQDGSVTFVLEFKDFKQGPVNLALYVAKLDPQNAACDAKVASCLWQVDPKMLDAKCQASVALPGQLAGDLVIAGGKNSNFPFSLPVNGMDLKITIYGARLQGKVQLQGDKVLSFEGILAGSVPKTSLLQAIDALPDGGAIPKDALKGIVTSLVQVDMDSDGDGVLDAASIGLKIKGIPGTISGTY